MAERWIDWIEPFGPENQPVYMRVPESTAVAVSKTIAASKGHTSANDQQALDDFVTVHWAKVIEPKPEMRVIEEFFALPEGTEKERMRQALRAALFEIFVEVSDGKCAKQTT